MLELLRRHGGRLMSVARRYSSTREDAEDAYQRAVEILLTRAPSTDPADLLPWMKTVVKHEAFAVRRQGMRHGTPSDAEEIEPLAGVSAGPAELAERRDRLRLGAEALRRLKPQEVRALLLRAEGLSYSEICAATGWSYTKVNRCISEGRRSFVDRVAGIEGGEECERLAPRLSALADGEAGEADIAALRPHLSGCLACRARLREYRRAPARAAALLAPIGAIGLLWGSVRGTVHSVGARLHEVGGAVQAAAAHKVAAVAASMAVVGGGAATVGVLDGGHAVRLRGAPVHVRPGTTPARVPGSGGHHGPATSKGSAPARVRRAAPRPSLAAPARRPQPPARRSAPAPAHGEFAPKAAPGRAPPGAASHPAPAASPKSPGGGEFAP